MFTVPYLINTNLITCKPTMNTTLPTSSSHSPHIIITSTSHFCEEDVMIVYCKYDEVCV